MSSILAGAAVGAGAGIGGAISNVALAPFSAANNFLGSAFFGYGMIIGERYAYQADWPKIQARLATGEKIHEIMHEYAGEFTAMVMQEAKIIFESVTTGFLKYIESRVGSVEVAQGNVQQPGYSQIQPDTRVGASKNTGGTSGIPVGPGTPAFLAGAEVVAGYTLPPETVQRYAPFSAGGGEYFGPGFSPRQDDLNRAALSAGYTQPTAQPIYQNVPYNQDPRTEKRIKDLEYSIGIEDKRIKSLTRSWQSANTARATQAASAINEQVKTARLKVLKYQNELDNIMQGEIFRGYDPRYSQTKPLEMTSPTGVKISTNTYYDPVTQTQKPASRGPYYYNS